MNDSVVGKRGRDGRVMGTNGREGRKMSELVSDYISLTTHPKLTVVRPRFRLDQRVGIILSLLLVIYRRARPRRW